MEQFQMELEGLADTDRLGAVLAESLPRGLTLALCGTLGAGKTRLVEAIAAALGVPREDVVSPTFVLCQQYQAQRGESTFPLYHFDAYRLRDEDEFLELGVEECFESDGITLIEWADRVAGCLPRDRLTLSLAVVGETQRRVAFEASGPLSRQAIAAIATQGRP